MAQNADFGEKDDTELARIAIGNDKTLAEEALNELMNRHDGCITAHCLNLTLVIVEDAKKHVRSEVNRFLLQKKMPRFCDWHNKIADRVYDDHLAKQANNGSIESRDKLMQRHKQCISKHCFCLTRNKNDAEELEGETNLRILSKLQTYQGGYFCKWHETISYSCLINGIRGQNKSKPYVLDDVLLNVTLNDSLSDASPTSAQTALPEEEVLKQYRTLPDDDDLKSLAQNGDVAAITVLKERQSNGKLKKKYQSVESLDSPVESPDGKQGMTIEEKQSRSQPSQAAQENMKLENMKLEMIVAKTNAAKIKKMILDVSQEIIDTLANDPDTKIRDLDIFQYRYFSTKSEQEGVTMFKRPTDVANDKGIPNAQVTRSLAAIRPKFCKMFVAKCPNSLKFLLQFYEAEATAWIGLHPELNCYILKEGSVLPEDYECGGQGRRRGNEE